MPERDRHVGETEMTDARFPERWMYDRRIRRLTADGFRLFVMSLTWSVSQRTDGVIDDYDLQQVPYVSAGAIDELEANELWRREGDRWIIQDFASTQTDRRELERLEAIRRADRERKSRQRTQPGSADVPQDNPPDVHADIPRLGEAKAKLGEEDLPPTRKTTSAQPPGAGWGVAACDECGRGPTRLNTTGRRLCGGCGPAAWTTDAHLGGSL